MKLDRLLCQPLPTATKIASVLHEERVTDPTEAESSRDAWKLSLPGSEHVAADTVRTI